MATDPNLLINQFAVQFLHSIGNNNPSDKTIAFVAAWATQEGGGTTNTCSYNFLNTMQTAPGSSSCTNIGIQSYPNMQTGVQANAAALKNGSYPSLLHALQTNDLGNLGLSNSSMASNVAGDLSVWLSGSRTISTDYISKILTLAGI